MKKFLSITKTWRDKDNGSTYFSTRVYNEGLNIAFVLPFQYGYETQSECEVKKRIDSAFINDAKIEFVKIENQKKKDVEKWGVQ